MVASQGLEPQQAESESAVLPLHHEAIAFLFRLAGSTGLEPATPGSTVQCANQLRHNPVAPKSDIYCIIFSSDRARGYFDFFSPSSASYPRRLRRRPRGGGLDHPSRPLLRTGAAVRGRCCGTRARGGSRGTPCASLKNSADATPASGRQVSMASATHRTTIALPAEFEAVITFLSFIICISNPSCGCSTDIIQYPSRCGTYTKVSRLTIARIGA